MQPKKHYTFLSVCLLVGAICILYVYHQVVTVPSDFPTGKNFTVNENESVRSISNRLRKEGYISSSLLFRAGLSFLDKDTSINVGTYVFDTPSSLLSVLHKFIQGKPDLPLLSVTVPEGSTSFEVASLVVKALPQLSKDIFGEMITKYDADGKLFPSTYFLLPSYKEEDIVKLMMNTFAKKAGDLFNANSTKAPLTSQEEVITLASILEGEAKSEEDMKIVAGILLARLKMGMALQVDVAPETYKQRGLPAMPINNPGLVAINAALNPVNTAYLYYITGKDGMMHYAKTFDDHKKNIQKYLK